MYTKGKLHMGTREEVWYYVQSSPSGVPIRVCMCRCNYLVHDHSIPGEPHAPSALTLGPSQTNICATHLCGTQATGTSLDVSSCSIPH